MKVAIVATNIFIIAAVFVIHTAQSPRANGLPTTNVAEGAKGGSGGGCIQIVKPGALLYDDSNNCGSANGGSWTGRPPNGGSSNQQPSNGGPQNGRPWIEPWIGGPPNGGTSNQQPSNGGSNVGSQIGGSWVGGPPNKGSWTGGPPNGGSWIGSPPNGAAFNGQGGTRPSSQLPSQPDISHQTEFIQQVVNHTIIKKQH